MNAPVKTLSLQTGYTVRGTRMPVGQPFDASLHAGELTVLLGPNGAGKSTLLRTLAGFQPPLSGQVLIGGRRIGELSRRELARTVAVVLTERPELTDMDVEQLVALGRTPWTGFWGMASAEDRKMARQAITLAGIEDLALRQVQSLSDGERQKVMIAKALAQATPVILLDEPTAFLDYPSKVETMQLLRRLAAEQGKAILLSTHDMDIALQTCHRAWLVDRTLPLAEGTWSELAANGELAKRFASPGIRFDNDSGLFRIADK